MTDATKSAFAAIAFDTDGVEIFVPGLSKREYFAGQAMQAYIAAGSMGTETLAQHSINAADALVAALNKKAD